MDTAVPYIRVGEPFW